MGQGSAVFGDQQTKLAGALAGGMNGCPPKTAELNLRKIMRSSKTILIVGDEINLRTTLAAIFQRAGYTITSSDNAKEALRYLDQQAFDLVFLDLKMPNQNGFSLLHELECIHPTIPVIILTAYVSSETAAQPYHPGAVGYLLKPIDPAKIVAYAEEVLIKNRRL